MQTSYLPARDALQVVLSFDTRVTKAPGSAMHDYQLRTPRLSHELIAKDLRHENLFDSSTNTLRYEHMSQSTHVHEILEATSKPKRRRLVNKPFMLGPMPPPSHLPQVDLPYTGDYRGLAWSSEALMATDITRQHAKQSYVRRLLQKCDFIGVSETHRTQGSVAAWQLPSSITAVWFHGTSQ